MLNASWQLIKESFSSYMADDCLSRGAAIAYYTVTSLAPVLIIVIAIAGLAFGHDAAQGALVQQLSGLMGQQSAEAIQSMIVSASNKGAGIVATILGVVTLLVTASGVFGEMQTSLNIIWKAQSPHSTVSRLVRARLASLGLVMALGFLLMVALVVSAGLSALGAWMNSVFPGFDVLLQILNFVISFLMISVLFGLIYKVLPDKDITWRDVAVGAVATAFLFTVGKFAISLYIGSSKVASSYGAAGAIAVMLIWIYYSSQIFLLGAEFTRAFAERHGSHADGEGKPEDKPGAATTPPKNAGSSASPSATPVRAG